jgi:hypothetical protein
MRNGGDLMTTFEVAEVSYGPGVDFSTRVELAVWTEACANHVRSDVMRRPVKPIRRSGIYIDT